VPYSNDLTGSFSNGLICSRPPIGSFCKVEKEWYRTFCKFLPTDEQFSLKRKHFIIISEIQGYEFVF
jgi:hypothetical protein